MERAVRHTEQGRLSDILVYPYFNTMADRQANVLIKEVNGIVPRDDGRTKRWSSISCSWSFFAFRAADSSSSADRRLDA